MITEIPDSADFFDAGLNQLYLAWQIAIKAVDDHEEIKNYIDHLDEAEAKSAADNYWKKSQPALANAFGLVQQAIEMALKGRIAAVSPYLLISRDPKDWPGRVELHPVPFSEFRTLDAADLVKVHNTFASAPLSEEFRVFWEELRRDRNKIMHSVTAKTFAPSTIIRSILFTAHSLFSGKRWPQQLFDFEFEGKYAAYGLSGDGEYNVVMGQINTAIRYLTTADKKRFFGFDSRRRAYVCPNCWDRANRDWQENWPALAQLRSKTPNERSLHCIVCDEDTEIERKKCISPHCDATVIYDSTCFTCLWTQDSPRDFPSGLADETLGQEYSFEFRFQGASHSRGDEGRFSDTATAIEHARRAMNASYLQNWRAVTIYAQSTYPPACIGSWRRVDGSLIWQTGFDASGDELQLL